MAGLHVTAGRFCAFPSPFHLRAAARLLTPSCQRSFSTTPVASASHASQGVANGPKNGAGKRLGAKKYGGEWVVPGVIIFRQRGSKWFPGENCDMGRDHTIFATQKGYVRYYRNPAVHPKRGYIGVAIHKDDPLPTPANAARRRRLDMFAAPRPADTPEERGEPWVPGVDDVFGIARDGSKLKMNRDYSFAQANRLIGRAAELAGVKVRPFKKNDRWLAWRKRAARAKRLEGTRALRASGGRKTGRKAKTSGKQKQRT